MQITGEGISFLSDLAQSAMDRDLEAMRQSNAYKLAEERGQTSKMEKLEKNAMRKSLLTRQALFLAEQALAAGSVVLNYEIAKAKGFATAATPLLGIPIATMMNINKWASLALIAAQTVANMPKFAQGGDFVTSGPQMIMVGDNPGGREHVQVTPISSPNVEGPQGSSNITLNISAPLVDDTVVDSIIPAIKEAIRRGEDIGVS